MSQVTQHFPSPRRIVTGHNSQGEATVVADSEIEQTPIMNGLCNFAVLWETRQFPSDVGDFVDPLKEQTQSLSNKSGVVLRVVDFPPNTKTVCPCLCTPGFELGAEDQT